MKKYKNILMLIALLLVISACNTSKEAVFTEAQMDKLHELAKNKSFKINAKWANPLATRSMNAIATAGLLPPGSAVNRIDLRGTTSFLEVKGDSVSAYLPYYGERQIAGTYNNSEIGIQFDGKPEDFQINYNESKKAYEMKFSIENKTEVFDINAILFANNSATLYVNSSQRLTINYQGTSEELLE